ncbi:MAG: formylmethanofuran--tetrahydromethanopterin N-formyltransferase [Candidatus Bathyarchaeia archaeon]
MSKNQLELIGRDEATGEFVVRHQQTGNISRIADTFAEMFPMWASRILITAEDEKWSLTAARAATGFACSIIMCPAEAGIECSVPPDKTPDGRPGVLIQIYTRTKGGLRRQLIERISQCVMTCPTSAAFDALPEAKRRFKVGGGISLFGDGFQRKAVMWGRRVWRIPVMEGEFIVENQFGVKKAIAGGNFLILAQNRKAGLQAAETAVNAISQKVEGVILPFPGGICRCGSKVGSIKYKLGASTNHPFCPKLRKLIPNSQIPEGVNCVYEIIINGLNQEVVRKAIAEGVSAAIKVPGVIKISAGNYGGKLGPFRAYLKEVLELEKPEI